MIARTFSPLVRVPGEPRPSDKVRLHREERRPLRLIRRAILFDVALPEKKASLRGFRHALKQSRTERLSGVRCEFTTPGPGMRENPLFVQGNDVFRADDGQRETKRADPQDEMDG